MASTICLFDFLSSCQFFPTLKKNYKTVWTQHCFPLTTHQETLSVYSLPFSILFLFSLCPLLPSSSLGQISSRPVTHFPRIFLHVSPMRELISFILVSFSLFFSFLFAPLFQWTLCSRNFWRVQRKESFWYFAYT